MQSWGQSGQQEIPFLNDYSLLIITQTEQKESQDIERRCCQECQYKTVVKIKKIDYDRAIADQNGKRNDLLLEYIPEKTSKRQACRSFQEEQPHDRAYQLKQNIYSHDDKYVICQEEQDDDDRNGHEFYRIDRQRI